jgi:hypothetical protein
MRHDMFHRKRSDTRVSTIEETYGIDLNVRGDMKIGNLLEERGFESLSQLVSAYRMQATSHARKRRVFTSFHAEDLSQVNGFRLMVRNPRVSIDFHDGGVRAAIDSEDGAYLRKRIRERINGCSVLACLIGNGTAWRDWVDWEIRTAIELGKGICGIRLKGSTGRAPPLLRELHAPVARWDPAEMVAAIECAAARRS